MKKPNDTIVNETKASFTLRAYILNNNITEFEYHEMKKKMTALYHKKYNGDSELAFKYFEYIYGHAIKVLKREGDIINIDKYKYNVKKTDYVDNELILDNFEWKIDNTISTIYKYVGDNRHLLPSFQRMTSWKSKKDYIELAYSIYKSTPLGIMYFWKISKDKAIDIKHYKFKRDIVSNVEMNFEHININEYKNDDVNSIIDGQQRITGINVIVNGSFNGEKLYFNEKQLGSKKFKFFKDGERLHWHSVEKIYNKLKLIFNKNINIDGDLKILANKIELKYSTLKMLFKGFFSSRLLAVCEISNAELGDVLELFIRTNKFGKKLSPADIVLSNIIGKDLDINVRKKIENITNAIRRYKSNYSFPSVLKLVSTYYTENAKMDYHNFSDLNANLENDDFLVHSNKSWKILKNSIDEVSILLEKNDFDSKWINSDNSLIPIIYWHTRYGKGKPIRNRLIIKKILNYILWAQLLRQFKGSTDNKINKLISEVKNSNFDGWKLGTDSKEANVNEIMSQLDKLKYNNKGDRHKIRILLSLNENTWKDADSFEHIWPQSRGGDHSIWNLALLPKIDNVELSNMTLDKKIKKLCETYNHSEEEIIKKLWLKKSLIYDTHNHKNYEKFIEGRKNHMMELISVYLKK